MKKRKHSHMHTKHRQMIQMIKKWLRLGTGNNVWNNTVRTSQYEPVIGYINIGGFQCSKANADCSYNLLKFCTSMKFFQYNGNLMNFMTFFFLQNHKLRVSNTTNPAQCSVKPAYVSKSYQ